MLYGLANIFRLHSKSVYEVDDTPNVDGRFICRGLHDVRLSIEVGVLLTIYKRYASAGIFTVLQCLDLADATAMSSKASHGKGTLGEHLVQILAKELSMEDDMGLNVILVNDAGELLHEFRPHPTDKVEKHGLGIP